MGPVARLSWPQRLLIAGAIGLLVIVAIPFATYAYFARDIDSKEQIMNRNDTGVTLLDRHERPFYHFYEAKNESFVGIDQIPKELQEALIAAEDKDFYQHPGVSLKATAAALYADLAHKELRYGGSTITQQLVKNTLLSRRKSFLRKYQEIVLAAEIDRRYSKPEILEMYLNSAYFGEGAFGVEAAAQTYFGKPARELTLAEDALLIAVLPAPSQLSPISGDAAEAEKGRQLVLQRMEELHYITVEQRQQAAAQPLAFKAGGNGNNFKAPHFALMVQEELINRYGEERIARSGFKVHTGLDLDWQAAAEAALNKQLGSLAGSQVTNGAVVVMDPKTGAVRALVGSRDWAEPNFGKINMATTPRQPGSSFKPIYYTEALNQKLITPATVLHDRPTSFADGYRPQNFDFQFRGDVLVRRALGNSLNVPAVEVMGKLGVPDAITTAKKFGITTLSDPAQYGLSLALGSGEVPLLELTNAYATLAAQGQHHSAALITQIDNKEGREIYHSKAEAKKVMEPEAPYLISSILSDPNARRETFANRLNTNRTTAVKTGSTEDYRDAWTLGYTPSLTIGVWIGNNDHTPMNNIAGSFGAAPVWKSLMEQFLANSPNEQFAQPSGIATRAVCAGNGLWATKPTGDSYNEYFIKGTEPTQTCISQKPEDKPNQAEPQQDEERGRDRNRNRDNDNED